ncbi:MAG: hypothetical protein N3D82_01760 [Ignisphaera sp.]|nr:hypothetical protein [Ignisphaera sp.]MCX8167745.1 hypothetical protein [Ignisphaera sp.]MDW8085308.1 helicase C-terminal domain-containing protein [Ignisphaera sp.]
MIMGNSLDFPYKMPRIGQLDLVKAILNLSEKVHIIDISAPTGFGKTISVLYSVAKIIERGIADRVLYVVKTRNELDPVIRESKNIGINFTVIYSGRRMCPYTLDKTISNESFWIVCSILRIRGRCQYYTRAIRSSIANIKSVVDSSDDHFTIARNLFKKIGVCPYFSLLALSEHVPLTIATYPYLFKEHIRLSALPHMNPARTLLIIDEAHNIINIGSLMGESIGISVITASIEEILKYHSNEKEIINILRRLAMIKVSGKGFKYVGKGSIGLEKWVTEKISLIASDIAMRVILNTENSTDRVMNRDLKIVYTSKFLEILSQKHYDLFALMTFNNEIELHTMPVSFDLLKKLIEQFKLIIMMSGTPPSKEFLSDILDVQMNVAFIDVEEFGASNYIRENSYVVIFAGASTSYKVRDEYMYKTYAKLISDIYGGRKWVTMVVYPSYEVMQNVLKHLITSDNSIIDRGEPLSVIKNVLLSKDGAILHTVAGGRLTEGIEITKNGESMIKCVIIIGTPYPQPDDYIEMILRDTRNREYRIDYYTEVAIVRTLQALGRAIRSEKDHALTILADKRYRSPSIIGRLKLNIKKVTASIDEIKSVANQFYNQLQFM